LTGRKGVWQKKAELLSAFLYQGRSDVININLPVSFLTIKDLTARWNCGAHTIQALAEENKINFYIRPIALELALESVAAEVRARVLKILSARPIHRYDVHKIFRNPDGQIAIQQFGHSTISELLNPAPQIFAAFCDLIIPKDDVESFEMSCCGCANNSQCFHPLSSDFSYFIYNGREYTFGEMQAKIIKRLWQAREDGEPWLYGKRLLADVGSGSDRIQSVFNHNSAWRKIILSDRNGKYKLNLPPKNSQMSLF
jgi:hypothetical protein